MEALEETSPLRQLYPETLYPNGAPDIIPRNVFHNYSLDIDVYL